MAYFFIEATAESDANITCLSYLVRCDANRIVSLCVTSPKVSKASKDTAAVAGGFAKKLYQHIYHFNQEPFHKLEELTLTILFTLVNF